MSRVYAYVGPETVRRAATREPPGRPVETLAGLRAWLVENPEALADGATFVVDATGTLRLAPRRSEHVACAGGGPVRAAGEIAFAQRPGGGVAVAEVSNQSTGFCPEPESFVALAAALDALGVDHPEGYTAACVFRRCPACEQINLVKDGWFACDVCGAELPRAWNFAG